MCAHSRAFELVCDDGFGQRALTIEMLRAEYSSDVVPIDCQRCGRTGSYRRDRLIGRFGGADAALPDVLIVLASCERRGTSLGHAVRGSR